MKKSTQTKERILEKAIEVVAEKGYSATSTKEIAKAAGVSEATLFKYYGTKEQLLKQIVLQSIEKIFRTSMQETIPQTLEKTRGDTGDVVFREIIKERTLFFQQHYSAIRIIFQEVAINDTVREIIHQKIWPEMIALSDHILNQGKEEGVFSKNIDNSIFRKVFFGTLFFSGFIEKFLHLNEKNKMSPEEEVNQIIELLYSGLKED